MAKTKNAKLVKGKCYSEKDVKQMFPNGKRKDYLCTWIHHTKYQNELHRDGIVQEPKPKDHIKLNFKNSKRYVGRHHFIISFAGGDFLYIGQETHIDCHDQKRNKIFIK